MRCSDHRQGGSSPSPRTLRHALICDIIQSMKTKTCNKCRLEKPITEFHHHRGNKDGLQQQCVLCKKSTDAAGYRKHKDWYLKRNEERRKRIREIVRDLKSAPCVDCGKSYPYYVMDFDHRSNKYFTVSVGAHRGIGIDTLLQEIDKCDVVCSNCHRIRTHSGIR